MFDSYSYIDRGNENLRHKMHKRQASKKEELNLDKLFVDVLFS